MRVVWIRRRLWIGKQRWCCVLVPKKLSSLFFHSFFFVCLFCSRLLLFEPKKTKIPLRTRNTQKKTNASHRKKCKKNPLLLLPSSSSSSSSFFCRPVKKKKERGFRIWKNNLKNDFTRPHLEKKRVLSYEHNKELFFFFHRGILSPEFVARFCRKRRSALPLSCSLCLSLCLLPALCRFERRNRSRGEGEREGGGASTASRFGKEFRRYARLRLDFSKWLISFFFIAGVRGRGSTLKTRGGIQQSVEKRQSRHY